MSKRNKMKKSSKAPNKLARKLWRRVEKHGTILWEYNPSDPINIATFGWLIAQHGSSALFMMKKSPSTVEGGEYILMNYDATPQYESSGKRIRR